VFGAGKQAKIDSSRKISEFFSGQQNSPSPTKRKTVEVQTVLTVSALATLEGKASNFERIGALEQVSEVVYSMDPMIMWGSTASGRVGTESNHQPRQADQNREETG
jgi:hypothetical protein